MAYRYQNNKFVHHRPPAYYTDNKLYPSAYSPTDKPTRTSRRMHEGLSLPANYGLDTVSDDINSSPFSSPYYINGRYNSDNSVLQRGNSASVQGVKRLLVLKEEASDFTNSDIQTTIKMKQGNQIKFELPFEKKVVGNTITLKNTGGSTGILSIYFSNGKHILYETAIDLCNVSMDKFEHFKLYSTTAFEVKDAPTKKLKVRMEIWGEIDKTPSSNPFNTDRYIEIASTGLDGHDIAEYRLQGMNSPIAEKYEYHRKPNRPLIGLIYSDYSSVPVNKLGQDKGGATVSLNGYRYDVFAIKDNTHAEMVIYDKEMNRVVKNKIKLDGRAENVYIEQCTDKNRNTWVYYVDGYSPLQRFKIGEWESQEVKSANSPVIGASLILLHNNRLYLTGFRNDKNLLQISAITSEGAEFENFPYRVYIPNKSPYDTSLNNITSMVEYTSDQIMVTGNTFFSLFQTNVNIEDGAPRQVSSFSDGGGVLSQGDIINYKGTLYSFNENEGIRRFNGSVWRTISNNIGSHFNRVDLSEPRKLWGYANKLYFNYTDRIDHKAKCLVWDMEMNYQQYPWFQDVDVPFCDVRIGEQLIGIHPNFPCIMELYAPDTWSRLDSPITFERHTKFVSFGSNATDMVIKRVHTKVLANANRWWWLGLSFDKHELQQSRGKDYWYRKATWDTESVDEEEETPFPTQDVYEEDAISRLTISELKVVCTSVQEKVKTKTFRKQASLVSILFESGVRQYL